jgi:hypothetical protein
MVLCLLLWSYNNQWFIYRMVHLMHMNILFTLTRLLELNWLLKLKHSPHSKWYMSLITRKILISSNTSRINSHTKRLFHYPTFLAFWLSCFVLLQQLINIFCLQHKTTSIMIQIPETTPEVSCWNFYIKLTIKLLIFTAGYYNVDHLYATGKSAIDTICKWNSRLIQVWDCMWSYQIVIYYTVISLGCWFKIGNTLVLTSLISLLY